MLAIAGAVDREDCCTKIREFDACAGDDCWPAQRSHVGRFVFGVMAWTFAAIRYFQCSTVCCRFCAFRSFIRPPGTTLSRDRRGFGCGRPSGVLMLNPENGVEYGYCGSVASAVMETLKTRTTSCYFGVALFSLRRCECGQAREAGQVTALHVVDQPDSRTSCCASSRGPRIDMRGIRPRTMATSSQR